MCFATAHRTHGTQDRSAVRSLVHNVLTLVLVGCQAANTPADPGTETVAVASVSVSPTLDTVIADQTTQLTATVHDAAGNALTGHTITWLTNDTLIAAVSPSGLVTGLAAGAATISATCEDRTGTATVLVIPIPVSAIIVSPNSDTIAVGETVNLSAELRDASGNQLSGRTTTWSSDNQTVANVDNAGLVTGLAGGLAVISATSEGVTGTSDITVTQATSSAAECEDPQAGWIWCDDFEEDRLNSYFEYSDAGGTFVRESGVGVGGSVGMVARFAAGQVSAGSLHLAVGRTPQSYFRPADDGTADYREVFWRVYLKNQAGWIGGGGGKLSRAFIFASPSTWAQAMIAHLWSGDSDYLSIDPASGTDGSGNVVTTEYNDFANLQWLGAVKGATPLFDAAHVGEWYCIETHVTLNGAGESNGVFEFWIDDNLEAQRTDLNWVDSYTAYGINAVYFENYWNDGSSQAQERYFDNIVVSTQRIRCQ